MILSVIVMTSRHLEELEALQKTYSFSAGVSDENALRAGFLEKAVLIGEIRNYILERETRKNEPE